MEQGEAAEVGKGQAVQGLGGTDTGCSSKSISAGTVERFRQSLTRQGSPPAHSRLLVILPVCQGLGGLTGGWLARPQGPGVGLRGARNSWSWPKVGRAPKPRPTLTRALSSASWAAM